MLKGLKGGQNDNQMKTIQHSPWAIHRSASVTPVQLSLWVFRDRIQDTATDARHLGKFQNVFNSYCILLPHVFLPYLDKQIFPSVARGRKGNSTFLLKVDWSCDHAIGIT